MLLNDILKNVTNIKIDDLNIKNITLDSRQATEGFLFCAIKGQSIDARKFIPQVIANNATAILADSDTNEDYADLTQSTPIIYITNLSQKTSLIAGNFYNHPSTKMQMVGITGTNGKTTISQLIAQWCTLLNNKTATMGTIGNGIYGELTEAENTTGSPLQIQQNLNNFYNQGAKVCTMEVSSHGLDQGRISAVDFDVAVFTNLTQDHLDYHKTMENYFMAKANLFTTLAPKHSVINIDDEYGIKLYNLIKDKSNIIITGQKNSVNASKYLVVDSIKYHTDSIEIALNSNYGKGTITISLVGEFNVNNVTQAMATMLALGYDFTTLCQTASKLLPVVGRMEVFSAKNKPTCIVDYAHTHDALHKALDAVKIHKQNKIWCIFGCGGDRDKGKRPLMAQVAEKNSDFVIITNDNPRTENDDEIIKDILTGIKNKDNAKIIKDRKQAIEFSIANATKDDIILIAGKGHEDYQIIGTEKIHCCDREITQNFLSKN